MKQGLLFREKEAKSFGQFGFGFSGEAWPGLAKVFCFFFSKKKNFLNSDAAEPRARQPPAAWHRRRRAMSGRR
jgi:hypothetical protein